MINDPVQLNGRNFTLGQLVEIARDGRAAAVSVNSEARIKKARALVEDWVKKGTRIYGVTTGFGALSDVPISFEDTKTLQRNILLSHAAGMGNCMDDDVVRAMMALRINDFCRGNSGLRLDTIQTLAHLLNTGIIPVVPEKGSVGASGGPGAHGPPGPGVDRRRRSLCGRGAHARGPGPGRKTY